MIKSLSPLGGLIISAIFVKLFSFAVLGFLCRIRRRKGSSSNRRVASTVRGERKRLSSPPISSSSFLITIATMCLRRKLSTTSSKVQNLEDSPGSRILDLPDLVVDMILSKLSPEMLCKMCSVSKDLYNRSSSDHLWQSHVALRWSHVAGSAAFDEWRSCGLSPYRLSPDDEGTTLCKPSVMGWPFSCLLAHWSSCTSSSSSSSLSSSSSSSLTLSSLHSRHRDDGNGDGCTTTNDDDDVRGGNNLYLKWYSALERGAFWFPAQVYNREHGHVGFLLSCYDAELCYDRGSDTFTARYPPHGSCSLLVEEGISWQRLRAPPVSATAHELYVSKCLDDLKPGDHIEVQWRRSKKFPYGWWYGVVGHLDTCDKDPRTCRCHVNDLVWLEFNQYAADSRWRRTSINRKTHQEKGSDVEGYYAGIRKLHAQDVCTWKQHWPREPLDYGIEKRNW